MSALSKLVRRAVQIDGLREKPGSCGQQFAITPVALRATPHGGAHGIDVGPAEIRAGGRRPVAQLETEAAMGIGVSDGLLAAAAYGLDGRRFGNLGAVVEHDLAGNKSPLSHGGVGRIQVGCIGPGASRGAGSTATAGAGLPVWAKAAKVKR